MADRNPQLRDAVLLVRRATMGMPMAKVNELAGVPWPDAVRNLLDAPVAFPTVGPLSDSDQLVTWWMEQITAPHSGLHERMAFFWHTLLTTNRWAVGRYEFLSVQLNHLRANALGNFRTLLQGFAVDPALIRFLNADGSTAENPNENLARELMELFTTGIGHYTEADVRAAALAMSGWRVDESSYTSYLDPERANTEPVTFMGETKSWDVASVVDRLCDHPATAARIGSKLWYHFTGVELSGDRAGELGGWWQAQNLEIKPLLERILNDPEMRDNHYVRPRSGFEYYVALQPILGLDLSELWRPLLLGQGLYQPPNVAGWPVGDRWLDPDSMLRRCGQVFSVDVAKVPGLLGATVEEMLDRCGLYVVGQPTIDAIDNAGAGQTFDDGSLAQLRWRIALTSPEFQLT